VQDAVERQEGLFFGKATKSLVKVAEETLANQGKHVQQIDAFVKVGPARRSTWWQAKTDYANSRVSSSIRKTLRSAKATVNQSMGVVGNTDFDVVDEDGGPSRTKTKRSSRSSKEPSYSARRFSNLAKQRTAQELTLRSTKGAYGPSLAATAAGSYAGTDLEKLVPNWSIGATLTWPILSGWQTHGVVHEAEANLENIDAGGGGEQLQIGFDVQQAWLGCAPTRQPGRVAGGADQCQGAASPGRRRYNAGTGSVIELGDAQVAATNAAAQVVQADYNLATARAQLLAAMGRS